MVDRRAASFGIPSCPSGKALHVDDLSAQDPRESATRFQIDGEGPRFEQGAQPLRQMSALDIPVRQENDVVTSSPELLSSAS